MTSLKSVLLGICSLLLVGCATRGSVSIQSGDHPLHYLRFVTNESLPAGKRAVSENGRIYFSNYFTPKGRPKFWTEIKKNSKSRYYATISILGDQRPYTIEFVVVKEVSKKNSAGTLVFSEVGRSESAAKAVLKYFQQNLEKSLKDRNVIDDFRVF